MDWDSVGTYREGTKADTVGHELFLSLCERAEELGLVPAFRPSLESHNYEWDFTVPGQQVKLCISIVHSGEDVLRLTSGEVLTHAEAFKIHICFPRAALHFLRETPESTEIAGTDKSYTFHGKLRAAQYADFVLLETTSTAAAKSFIAPGGGIEKKLADLRSGEQERKKGSEMMNSCCRFRRSLCCVRRGKILFPLRTRGFRIGCCLASTEPLLLSYPLASR